MKKRSFWIVTLLFVSAVINYLDRQSLSILARTIQTDLHLTDLDYSRIVQMYLLPYTIAYLLAGRITDWLKPRKAMAMFILVWSAADLCTGFISTGLQLGLTRFFLGLGEPGNWTASPKAISETLESKSRPFALGVISFGATVGAVIAPPLISFLALRFSWRSAFVATGALGMIWVVPWYFTYPRATAEPQPQVAPAGTSFRHEVKRWVQLMGQREVWLLAVLRMVSDPVWYFYLFWFPKYLSDARHLTLGQLGSTAWVIYVAAGFGSLIAGLAVSRRISKGGAPVKTERYVMTVLACLAPVGVMIPFAHHLYLALLLAGIVVFAQVGWQTISMALTFNYFSPEIVATAWGIICAGSGLGGLLSTNLIGHTITSFSYIPVFYALAVLHPLALIFLWRIRVDRRATMELQPSVELS